MRVATSNRPAFIRCAMALCGFGFTLSTGCAQIAGIDDPPEVPNGSAVSNLCSTYCDTVIAACPDPAYVYASRDMCLGVCHDLEVVGKSGSPSDQSGDTIYCRLFYAKQAFSTGEASTCPEAGPGGNSICGTNCEAYCVLMQQTCPNQFANPKYFNGSLSTCITQCGQLPQPTVSFNADQLAGNTVNCRLYHVSAAAANPDAPATHCPHATGDPTMSPCVDL